MASDICVKIGLASFSCSVKHKEGKLKQAAHNKRVVTKPLPLMYKSSKKVLGKMNDISKSNTNNRDDQSRDRRNRAQSEEHLPNIESRDRRRKNQKPQRTRSADNSPTRNRFKSKLPPAEPTSDPEDLRKNGRVVPLSSRVKKPKKTKNKSSKNNNRKPSIRQAAYLNPAIRRIAIVS